MDKTTAIEAAATIVKLNKTIGEYEETGLNPAEIEQMKVELQKYKDTEENGLLVRLPCKVGDEVYIVERDEYGEPCGSVGYMFLASTLDAVIVSVFIGGITSGKETVEEHIRETADNEYTLLYVFPAKDCYASREEAERALKEAHNDQS